MARGASPFAAAPGGIKVRLKVTPRAARMRIGGIAVDADGAGALKVEVTAAPEGGKANAQVIKLLAKEWRLPRSSLGIAAGGARRRKTLFIAGDPDALAARANQWPKKTRD